MTYEITTALTFLLILKVPLLLWIVQFTMDVDSGRIKL